MFYSTVMVMFLQWVMCKHVRLMLGMLIVFYNALFVLRFERTLAYPFLSRIFLTATYGTGKKASSLTHSLFLVLTGKATVLEFEKSQPEIHFANKYSYKIKYVNQNKSVVNYCCEITKYALLLLINVLLMATEVLFLFIQYGTYNLLQDWF